MSTISLIQALPHPVLLLLGVVFFSGCSKKENDTQYITIRGTLENLPEGSVIIEKLDALGWKTLDSLKSNNGHFEFKFPSTTYPEPIQVFISHYDTNQVKRGIFFSTGTKGKAGYGGIESCNTFWLEDGIQLNGTVTLYDSRPGYPFHSDQVVRVGKQTRVMYDDTAGFGVVTNPNILKKLVKQHPYSYYYLDIMKRRAGRSSNAQFYALFNLFDHDVQESATGRTLKNYVDTRHQYKLTTETSLPDSNGTIQSILNRNANLTMVILWASWCGPCRAEIPQLKKIHQKFADQPSFQMVSISIDDDKSAWNKAMQKEKMPWKQLLMTPEAMEFSKEIFGFTQQVPLTLFVDGEGETINSFLGYGEESTGEFEGIIAEYLPIQKPL